MLLHVRQKWHFLNLEITAWLLKLRTLATVYWYAAFISDRNIKKTNFKKNEWNTSHVYLQKRSTAGNITIQHELSGFHNRVFAGRYGLDLQKQFALTSVFNGHALLSIVTEHWPLTPGFGPAVTFVVDKVELPLVFSPNTLLFPCQYHSTIAPHTSSYTCCSYQNDKQSKPRNLQKGMIFGNRR